MVAEIRYDLRESSAAYFAGDDRRPFCGWEGLISLGRTWLRRQHGHQRLEVEVKIDQDTISKLNCGTRLPCGGILL